MSLESAIEAFSFAQIYRRLMNRASTADPAIVNARRAMKAQRRDNNSNIEFRGHVRDLSVSEITVVTMKERYVMGKGATTLKDVQKDETTCLHQNPVLCIMARDSTGCIPSLVPGQTIVSTIGQRLATFIFWEQRRCVTTQSLRKLPAEFSGFYPARMPRNRDSGTGCTVALSGATWFRSAFLVVLGVGVVLFDLLCESERRKERQTEREEVARGYAQGF